jgi:hypothetical protein
MEVNKFIYIYSDIEIINCLIMMECFKLIIKND